MRTADVWDVLVVPARVARLIGVSRAACSRWGEVVPLESAMAIEAMTRGRLKVDRSCYPLLARADEALRQAAAAAEEA